MAGDRPTAEPGDADADAVEGGPCPSNCGVCALEVMPEVGTLGCVDDGAFPASRGESPAAAGLRPVAASLARAAAAKLMPADNLLVACA